MVWVALSMCNRREHVDQSLPNEDIKFQYCTMKHRVASKCFRMHSFRRSLWEHIVSRGWRSSFVLKLYWRLQKLSECCKKRMVMNAYRTNIFEWCGKFHNGRKRVDDDPRARRHRTSRTPEYIAKVCVALADDWSSTIRMLAKWFHIDKETVRKIITEDLGGKNVCAQFVSRTLTSEQWEDCLISCCDFLQMHKNDSEFFNIITGDESWCFTYDPESKRHSATWVGSRSPKAKELCFEKSGIKSY